MTKRNIRNELDDLSEELLDDLSAEEQLQIFLKATARGKTQWKERLVESAARASHTLRRNGFTHRATIFYTTAQAAVADLYSTLVWYLSIESIYTYSAHVTLLDNDLPAHPLTSVEGVGPTPLLVRLYVGYGTYRRFAEEEIGVSLSTWLSPIPDGEFVTEAVPDVLDEKEAEMRRLCESPENQDIIGVNLPSDPDQAVEDAYEQLTEAYRDAVSD